MEKEKKEEESKMQKFELTEEFKEFAGKKVFRIKALKDFGDVKAGELGGYVEKEENLSRNGDAWVFGNAWVFGDARVSGDAWVSDNASVSGDADYATIKGFGSEQRSTTFYRQKDGTIWVTCGRFCGTLEQFREKVRQKHGETKYAREYLALAEAMRIHFEEDEDD